MYTLIVSIILFSAVLLVLVILAQNSKGGGLSSQFGGSGASSMIGVKKTSDLLEKLTWGLAIVILVLSLVSNIHITGPAADDFTDKIGEQSPELPSLPTDDGALIPTDDISSEPADSSSN